MNFTVKNDKLFIDEKLSLNELMNLYYDRNIRCKDNEIDEFKYTDMKSIYLEKIRANKLIEGTFNLEDLHYSREEGSILFFEDDKILQLCEVINELELDTYDYKIHILGDFSVKTNKPIQTKIIKLDIESIKELENNYDEVINELTKAHLINEWKIQKKYKHYDIEYLDKTIHDKGKYYIELYRNIPLEDTIIEVEIFILHIDLTMSSGRKFRDEWILDLKVKDSDEEGYINSIPEISELNEKYSEYFCIGYSFRNKEKFVEYAYQVLRILNNRKEFRIIDTEAIEVKKEKDFEKSVESVICDSTINWINRMAE